MIDNKESCLLYFSSRFGEKNAEALTNRAELLAKKNKMPLDSAAFLVEQYEVDKESKINQCRCNEYVCSVSYNDNGKTCSESFRKKEPIIRCVNCKHATVDKLTHMFRCSLFNIDFLSGSEYCFWGESRHK